MSKNIATLLKEASKGILTDETLLAIEEAYNSSVDAKVNDRVSIQVEQALREQDEDYSKKLKTLLEKIDEDHSKKFTKAITALDNNRARKLKNVVEKYNRLLKEDAKLFKDQVVDSLSQFLEVALEEVIPTATIAEATKNTRAMSLLTSLREQLEIDYVTSKPALRDALRDGKRQLDEKTELTKKLVKENVELRNKAATAEKKAFLLEKTINFDDRKRDFIVKSLQDKDFTFIKENFDYAVRMFDKRENNNKEILREQATQTAKTKGAQALKNTKIVEESKKPSNPYLQELERY